MEYWIIIDDNRQGPLTAEEIAVLPVNGETPVWHEGLADWAPLATIPELAAILAPVSATIPAVPVEEYVQPVAQEQVSTAIQPETAPAAIVYAPVGAIPPGYVAIAPAAEPKSPPTYLVWAIISTIVCFLPLGVCAIICSLKVKNHFRAGNLEKAAKMSERTALFIILSIVVWLIWLPFSVVYSMF